MGAVIFSPTSPTDQDQLKQTFPFDFRPNFPEFLLYWSGNIYEALVARRLHFLMRSLLARQILTTARDRIKKETARLAYSQMFADPWMGKSSTPRNIQFTTSAYIYLFLT